MQGNIFQCNDYRLAEVGIVEGSGSALCIRSCNKFKKNTYFQDPQMIRGVWRNCDFMFQSLPRNFKDKS